jgi:uncharacterized membrane protein YeaQ/YmgE (transglycosylase-associated protein family)
VSPVTGALFRKNALSLHCATHLGIAGPGQQGMLISIIIAVVGAVLLTLILRLVSGGRIREI